MRDKSEKELVTKIVKSLTEDYNDWKWQPYSLENIKLRIQIVISSTELYNPPFKFGLLSRIKIRKAMKINARNQLLFNLKIEK